MEKTVAGVSLGSDEFAAGIRADLARVEQVIADGIAEAADGAGKLDDGAGKLAEGADQGCPRGCSHDEPDCALDAWVAAGHAGPGGELRLDSLRRLLRARSGESDER